MFKCFLFSLFLLFTRFLCSLFFLLECTESSTSKCLFYWWFFKFFKGKSHSAAGWENVDNEEMEAARADNAPEKCDFDEEALVGQRGGWGKEAFIGLF